MIGDIGVLSTDSGSKLKEEKVKTIENFEKNVSSIEAFSDSFRKANDLDPLDYLKKEKNVNSKYKSSDLFDSNDPKDRLDTLLKSLEKSNKDNVNENTKKDGEIITLLLS